MSGVLFSHTNRVEINHRSTFCLCKPCGKKTMKSPLYVSQKCTSFYSFQITPENVYDVMQMSDMFFLPDLKRQCGSYLANFIDIENVVDLLQTARLFSIPRLEHQCVEFMASAIEEVF